MEEIINRYLTHAFMLYYHPIEGTRTSKKFIEKRKLPKESPLSKLIIGSGIGLDLTKAAGTLYFLNLCSKKVADYIY